MFTSNISRRRLLQLLAVSAGGAAVLAACGGTSQSATAPASTAAASSNAPAASASASASAASSPAATGQASASTSSSGAATSGKLTIAQGVDAESMDPYLTTSGASKSMLWSIYDKLANRDVDLKVIPWLATAWKAVNDTTWQLTLRQGVEFHNGEKFNAQAVKFSIERFTNPALKNGYASLLKPIKSVDPVNDYTVNIVTDGPFALLMEILSVYCEILPPVATAAKGATTPITEPIGTGPYKYVGWTPGDRLKVAAAKPHFSGQPHAASIDWRVIPENAARLVELKTGGADLISNVPPAQQQDVISGGAKVQKDTSLSSLVVVMSELKSKPFTNVKVRQAMNYAVNRDQIIAKILDGAATPLAGPFAAGIPGYDPALKPYPFDPAKAKQLLSEAGYPNGFDLTLHGPNGRYLQDSLVTQAIAGQLTDVGIRTKVVTVGDFPTFVKGIIGREYEAFFFAQGGIITDATASINWDSNKKGIAWQGYTNPQVDTLIEQAPKTVDETKRTEMYRQMVDILYTDAPWLFMYSQQDLYGVGKRVRDFQPTADSYIHLGNMSVAG